MSHISPDGRYVPVGDGPQMFDPTDGTTRQMPRLQGTEEPLGWSTDGRSVYPVARPTVTRAQMYRVDIASGRRDLVRDLQTAGPTVWPRAPPTRVVPQREKKYKS